MTAALMESALEISIVTPEAQNALVEIFRVLEKLGGRPPANAVVFAAARGIDVAFKDGDAKTLLAKFRNVRPSPAPLALLARTAPAPGIEHERTSPAPDAPLARPDGAGATRAGDKVFLVPKPEGESGAHEDRSKPGPGLEFGTWFFGAAMGAKALPEHFTIDPGPLGFALAHIESSTALVTAHGAEACKIRARRMFARKARTDQHKLRMHVNPGTLARNWEMFETDDVGRAAAATTTTAFGDNYAEKSRKRLELLK